MPALEANFSTKKLLPNFITLLFEYSRSKMPILPNPAYLARFFRQNPSYAPLNPNAMQSGTLLFLG